MYADANVFYQGWGLKKTHVAHRLDEAKKALSTYSYDACLTDLNLPMVMVSTALRLDE